jgi:PTH2 family peptidyl-tRNA hydrolase
MAAAIVIGVVFGAAVSRVVSSRWARPGRKSRAPRAAVDGGSDDDDDDDSDDESEGEEAVGAPSSRGPHKMVLVVRTDLKMTKGKIAAQCCHGAIGAYQLAEDIAPDALRRWERSGCAKVALQVASEEALTAAYRAARAARLPHYLVVDAGRTQIEPGSKTVCAIGPAPVGAIDQLTGGLKLL